MSYAGFILSRRREERNYRTVLIFQGRLADGRRFHWTVNNPRLVFFISRRETWIPQGAVRKEVELCTLRGDPVDALYFENNGAMFRARQAYEGRNTRIFEGDINVINRYLMERFIQGSVAFESEPVDERNGILYFIDPKVKPSDFTPRLRSLSLDIECSMEMELYSIALYGDLPGDAKTEDTPEDAKDAKLALTLMVEPGATPGTDRGEYRAYPDETTLLKALFEEVRKFDPDVFIGWSVIGFDLQWLQKKCQALRMSLDLGVDGPAEIVEPQGRSGNWAARIPGRATLDGIAMLRAAFITLEDYSLNTASSVILGKSKLIEKTGREKVAEITRQFLEDKPALARYNLEDTRLVHDIFEKRALIALAVRRSQLTGLSIDRNGGSVAAYDFLYLPRLHRRGYVADTDPLPPPDSESAPGGLVLDSKPGFYQNVAVFDFKSLYPSIIRTFKVDPLAAAAVLYTFDERKNEELVKLRGPAGLAFAPAYAILPDIIDELWAARDKAKAVKDATLSHAVKIIMNSFYGVLGSPGCRFFDPRLAGTITRIGHWILRFSRDWLEERGFTVIYGDTDSLFIVLGEGDQGARRELEKKGEEISQELNRRLEQELDGRFHVESRLDIEFEKTFAHFFMPTVRGADTGSKKRYAGMLYNESGQGQESDLYFSGLESNRRDWTALARDFQRDLFLLMFENRGRPELEDWFFQLVRERKEKLLAGELDKDLVYRKGISKPLSEYTANIPPHVRAAKALDEMDGRVVFYVMTLAGPEPIQKRSGAPLDYEHYSEKQLAPIADMLLRYFETEYSEVTGDGKQLGLFGT